SRSLACEEELHEKICWLRFPVYCNGGVTRVDANNATSQNQPFDSKPSGCRRHIAHTAAALLDREWHHAGRRHIAHTTAALLGREWHHPGRRHIAHAATALLGREWPDPGRRHIAQPTAALLDREWHHPGRRHVANAAAALRSLSGFTTPDNWGWRPAVSFEKSPGWPAGTGVSFSKDRLPSGART